MPCGNEDFMPIHLSLEPFTLSLTFSHEWLGHSNTFLFGFLLFPLTIISPYWVRIGEEIGLGSVVYKRVEPVA